MSVSHKLGAWAAAIIAVVAFTRGEARAQTAETPRMAVVIDASGSMLTQRVDGKTRFIAARDLAKQRVQQQVTAVGETLIAVYIFRNTQALVELTSGFVPANTAFDVLDGMTDALAGGSTPLAGALCEAATILAPYRNGILQISSDGLENSTPASNPCAGPDDADGQPPYDETSWQGKVLGFLAGKVQVRIDLFDASQIGLAPATASPLVAFFTALAETTGGALATVYDDEPAPVPGDLDGDRCVGRSDAILVARAFGPVTDGRFDLDASGVVDFADYAAQAALISPACGPDPYTPTPPIVCTSGEDLVIDGAALESPGISVDPRGTCRVTIRNSLIVAGYSGIGLKDRARVTLDGSLVIGYDSAAVQFGRGVISAGSTLFRGGLQLKDASDLIDRGGNVFE